LDDKAFRVACLSSSNETIVELLKYSTIDINKNSKWAVKNNLLQVVRLLLAHPSIDVNKDYCGKTLISKAAAEGHVEIVNLLLNDDRVNVNPLKTFADPDPLYQAIKKRKLAVLDLLINNSRVNKNIKYYGQNILYMAVEQDWLEGVKLCIPHVNIQEKYYAQTVLGYAARRNCVKVFPCLLSIPTLNVKEQYCGDTCLDIAGTEGNFKIVQLLRDSKKFTEKELYGSLCKFIYKEPIQIIKMIKNNPLIQSVQNNTFFTGDYRQSWNDDFTRKALLDFCVVTQGDLNNCNVEGQRPLDATHQWYASEVACRNKNICLGKKYVYFKLLQLTPSWSYNTLQETYLKWFPKELSQKIITTYIGIMLPESDEKAVKDVLVKPTNKRQLMS
jgi:ankyrin repeat protein